MDRKTLLESACEAAVKQKALAVKTTLAGILLGMASSTWAFVAVQAELQTIWFLGAALSFFLGIFISFLGRREAFQRGMKEAEIKRLFFKHITVGFAWGACAGILSTGSVKSPAVLGLLMGSGIGLSRWTAAYVTMAEEQKAVVHRAEKKQADEGNNKELAQALQDLENHGLDKLDSRSKKLINKIRKLLNAKV